MALALLSFGSAGVVGCASTPHTHDSASPAWEALSGFEGPWSDNPREPALESAPERAAWPVAARRQALPARSNIVEVAFRFYSRHLTQVDGARCEHRPTCSRYAILSIRKHGLLVGSWLTVDRLMRTDHSSVLRFLPRRAFEGGTYFVDPVEANDFYFHRPPPAPATP